MEEYTHIFYNIERFEKLFLNIDFDNYFIEKNNNLVNSDEHYLKYKSEYFLTTNHNFDLLKILIEKFKLLDNNYIKLSDINKYIYHFIDKTEYDSINNQLKNILEVQKKTIQDFTTYINFLNSEQPKNVNLIKQSNIALSSKRNF